jgi:TDG/mug DNA glycosylase family protein
LRHRTATKKSQSARVAVAAPEGSLRALPDVIAPNLTVLFCGLNPGLQAAETGHHFAGRGNRFWRTLYLAGFTSVQISPEDDASVLQLGYGLTTAVARPTNGADEVARSEFVEARANFELKVSLYAPRCVAFLGKAAYGAMFDQAKVGWGRQSQSLSGAMAWILPNPSGRNRGFQLATLVQAYRHLRQALEIPPVSNTSTRSSFPVR